MIHRHGDKTRWDKTPADYDDTKNSERRGAGIVGHRRRLSVHLNDVAREEPRPK